MNKSAISFLMLAFLLLAGCASDRYVEYVDPASKGEIAGTGIESQDVIAAAQKAVQSIVSIPEISGASRPPLIQIAPVANRTASPIDATLYTSKLRNAMMQSAFDKVRFLARDASSTVNDAEQALRNKGKVEKGPLPEAERVGATYDYLLTAELQGISAATSQGQSDYFLITFKLVNFKDILIWSDEYEVKKEGNESAVYR